MSDFEKIKQQISSKNLSQFYLLHGEEPFFIDRLVELFEKSVLLPEERDFNQVVLYGAEVSAKRIVEEAKQFPFGSPYRLVIVKEAQSLAKSDIEELENYLKNPNPGCVLVISAKGKKIDGRSSLVQLAKKKYVEFYSPKIKDYEMVNFIQQYLTQNGITANRQVCELIYEGVGTELSVLQNEVEKIKIYYGNSPIHLRPEDVEKHLGVSREFNSYELIDAIFNRDIAKALRIITFYKKNPKQHAPIGILAGIFNSFQQLYTLHVAGIMNKDSASEVLKIHPYRAGNFLSFKRNYSMEDCEFALLFCTNCDARLKGVDNANTEDFDVLFELVYRLINKYWM
ncbi:DNA polymerase III subunit delta [Schleiferia thermophila]|uniref:DNA polymerase III subunit delta n=1 Tax=Schleiferia thermophila TaxID=884107 RepID=UPI003EEF93DB